LILVNMKKEKENIFNKILKRKKIVAFLLVIIIIGFVAWRLLAKRGSNVETAKVEKGMVESELVLSGFINADEYAKLSFSTSGNLSWVGVKEGQEVKKGQMLGKLDSTSLNSAYQQARSTLRAAEATVQNIHDQVKDHSGDETYVQKDTRTTAEVTKDRAYESMLIAQDNLKNATLYSPFSGIVTYVANSFPGMMVMYTQTQFEVINPETLYFDVTADQTEVIDVYMGQKVKVLLDSLSDEEMDGEISFIGYTPRVGESGTSYKIKVKFNGSVSDVKKYRVGMTGDAKFILEQKEDVLYVPPKFITSDNKGKYVSLSKKNNKTYIEVGIESEDRVEIKGDIKEGDILYD